MTTVPAGDVLTPSGALRWSQNCPGGGESVQAQGQVLMEKGTGFPQTQAGVPGGWLRGCCEGKSLFRGDLEVGYQVN